MNEEGKVTSGCTLVEEKVRDMPQRRIVQSQKVWKRDCERGSRKVGSVWTRSSRKKNREWLFFRIDPRGGLEEKGAYKGRLVWRELNVKVFFSFPPFFTWGVCRAYSGRLPAVGRWKLKIDSDSLPKPEKKDPDLFCASQSTENAFLAQESE